MTFTISILLPNKDTSSSMMHSLPGLQSINTWETAGLAWRSNARAAMGWTVARIFKAELFDLRMYCGWGDCLIALTMGVWVR